MPRSKRRYMILTDPDDRREGEVRLGAKYNEDEGWYEGGELIFKWSTNQSPKNLYAPQRVVRIVELANKALDELG